MNRRLYRSRTDSVLGGVAGGVAEYLDADPAIVRIIWAILAIVTGGMFVVLYIVMWIVVPEARTSTPSASTAPASAAPGGAPTTGPDAAAPTAGEPAESSVSGAPAPPRRGSSGGGTMVLGLILVGLGAWFLIREYVPQIDADLLWPVGLVALGIVLVIASLRRPRAE